MCTNDRVPSGASGTSGADRRISEAHGRNGGDVQWGGLARGSEATSTGPDTRLDAGVELDGPRDSVGRMLVEVLGLGPVKVIFEGAVLCILQYRGYLGYLGDRQGQHG